MTFLSRNGLYQNLEIDLIDDPDRRLRLGNVIKKFNVSRDVLTKRVRQVRMSHGLPLMQHGGPNFVLPDVLDSAIEQTYLNLPEGASIADLVFAKEIAMRTGGRVACYVRSVQRPLADLESKYKRGIRLNPVLPMKARHSVDAIIEILGKEAEIAKSGIHLRRFRERTASLRFDHSEFSSKA